MNRRDRVECLGLDLLKDGVSTDEADHEGVCVQEVPKSQQKNDPAVAGKPYVTYHDYNKANCADTRLEVCFRDQPDTQYGTLSHSHLLLVLLSFLHGAAWKVPTEWAGLLDGDGRWTFAAVAASDPSLETLCKTGLHWRS